MLKVWIEDMLEAWTEDMLEALNETTESLVPITTRMGDLPEALTAITPHGYLFSKA